VGIDNMWPGASGLCGRATRQPTAMELASGHRVGLQTVRPCIGWAQASISDPKLGRSIGRGPTENNISFLLARPESGLTQAQALIGSGYTCIQWSPAKQALSSFAIFLVDGRFLFGFAMGSPLKAAFGRRSGFKRTHSRWENIVY